MKNKHWNELLKLIAGEPLEMLPTGLIIDSPWLPGWAGIDTLDYFTSDELWFQANLKAEEVFEDLWFLPGFWAEYGMCTEPSAFGARCSWHRNELPFAHKTIHSLEEIDRLVVPDPAVDGLAPFVIKRLERYRSRIEQAGHSIRFAVARGPLNVASFMMGATEFLMALRDDSLRIHKLLRVITDYLIQWLDLQIKTFDSIEGILVLDDIVGFCGEPDFLEFARPYLTEIFQAFNVPVKLFHNDADGRVCAGYLHKMGVNIFNFSFLHNLAEMREWAGDKLRCWAIFRRGIFWPRANRPMSKPPCNPHWPA